MWNDIREKSNIVNWANLVWFSQCIPRHSFMVWLVIHGRLKTQDIMGVWEKRDDMVCVFCKSRPDSHNHLFFECDFPCKVWNEVKCLVKLDLAPNLWSDIQKYILRRPINKSIWSIMQRLVVGASIYFLWQERNLRMFQGRTRTFDEVCNLIKDTVRLRVMNLSLNASPQVFEAASIWKFHVVQSMGRKRVHFKP